LKRPNGDARPQPFQSARIAGLRSALAVVSSGQKLEGKGMFTVGSGFIGNFKLGDNINHNLAVLALLYRYSREGDAESKRLLCKPITILLVSVIEAVLHDFHSRIRTFTWEGVMNLPPSISEYVRSLRRIDELEKYIASAKKHDFFDAADQGFYDRALP
jgi:hypothetical protein